ncbi:MAG TPA: hypothetical protein VLD39_08225 [Gammaproteobacteria bacterium]|nr:hypothetical protein [Gammaproteobacteria bacterium]
MNSILGKDDRYLDRRGCGDEFDNDGRLKLATWLSALQGAEQSAGVLDYDDEYFDDSATH